MVPRASLAAHNLAHRHKAELVLPGQEPLRLSLAPRQPAKAPHHPPGSRIGGRVGTHAFSLYAPQELVASLSGTVSRTASPEALSPRLRGLLFEDSICRAVEALERIGGRAVVLEALEDIGPGDDAAALEGPGPGYAVQVGVGDRSWTVWLDCPAGLWDEIALAWPVAAWDVDELPVRGEARVGAVNLGRRVLASLRPGDVLLPEGEGIDPNAGRLVLADSLGAGMVKVDENWLLTEAPGMIQEQPTEDMGVMDGIGTGEEPGLDELPVRLTFDVGHLEVPLGRLREMDAGTVLDLGREVAEFVGISANGRRIGKGELVDIEGRLGVRITRIFGRE